MTSPINKDWPRKKYNNEQERKCHKPILEKKRRARINKSLDQLKTLLLETLKGEAGHFSKLEKADILEMTVKHLQDVQQNQLKVAMVMDPTVQQRYRSGYSECSSEVDRYLSTVDGLQPDVKGRLMDHLEGCGRQQTSPFSSSPVPTSASLHHLSALQNVPLGLRPGLSTQQSHPLAGPVSPPMYQNILDTNKASDRIQTDYKMAQVQQSPAYSTLSNSLSLSIQESQSVNRSQNVIGSLKEKSHTITSQHLLNEHKVNTQRQSPVLHKPTVVRSLIKGKENSTRNKELSTLNINSRRLAETQSKPLGDLTLNSLNYRVTPKQENNRIAESHNSGSWFGLQNMSPESSTSGSSNVVKEESMWRPW